MAELYDSDGKLVEGALSPDEVATEKAAREAAEKKAADLEVANKTLAEEVNPNWQKVRKDLADAQKKAADYEAKLKEGGIKVGEEERVTLDQLREEATKAAEKSVFDSQKRRLLGAYDEKQRPVVEKFLEKVTSGETVTAENIDVYMAQAEVLAGIGGGGMSPAQRALSAAGRAPNTENGTEPGFSDTEGGKSLAGKLGIQI